ncbi:MAG: hypothetical protein LAKADJCE_00998 [Candidatus Argoarchaeum ethanivorans]|uniref:Uncharacterized protein n=1 Tax=Candidatus Argoarchaeum ethanivorans TaxID=2608793 RepID=A0A811TKF0_9EURY|nr:MAG: hypothetical protein LAKADJCE_00998 [Candidatus Argoarchaeum ethanivorans]
MNCCNNEIGLWDWNCRYSSGHRIVRFIPFIHDTIRVCGDCKRVASWIWWCPQELYSGVFSCTQTANIHQSGIYNTTTIIEGYAEWLNRTPIPDIFNCRTDDIGCAIVNPSRSINRCHNEVWFSLCCIYADITDIFYRVSVCGRIKDTSLVVVVPVAFVHAFMHIPVTEDMIISKEHDPHAIAIARYVPAIVDVTPAENHRSLRRLGGVVIDIIPWEPLEEAIVCLNLHCVTLIHPAYQIAQILNIRSNHRTLILEVYSLIRIPQIVRIKGWSLMVAVCQIITINR